jgi:hypothetical protein
MRILLIEDFGKRQGFEDYIREVFMGLLGEDAIYEHWSDDERNLTEKPSELLNFFQQYSPHHEAVLCRYWSDFENTQKEWHILRDFDVILIDINLSEILEEELQKPVPKGYLHEKGGFYIYNELIRQGFADDKICFLTGEGDTLGSFLNLCHDNSLPEPLHYFEKRDKGFEGIRNWLESKQSDKYLSLRRGIIEGCHYILSQLESRPATEVIKFDQFIEQENASDMQAYLKILQNFLSIRQPEDKQTQYKLFVRTLVHEWDSAVHPDNLPRCNENDDKDCWQARRLNTTFGWILKNARNWITHSTFLDDLSEPEVAFLFIIAMRAMFKLAPTTEKYERMLFSLFNAENPDSMADKIGEPKNYLSPVRIFLAETYSELKNKIFAENEKGAKVNDAFYFNEMLNNLQNGKVSHDYKRGLFQMFWHGLSPVRLHKNPKDEKVSFVPPKTNMVRTNYSFHYHDYGAQKKGFLFDLACHIYKISF